MSDSWTPPLLDGLSPLEEAVVDAARRGTWAMPETVLEVEHLAVTDDPGTWVRAELIRELVMGRRGELDPRGVGIQRMRVVGPLDLDHVTAVTGLSLVACALPDGMTCRHARLRHVDLSTSMIIRLTADGLRTDGNLFVRHATVVGTEDEEALRLLDAHIGGQLNLEHTTVANATGPAFYADGLRTDGDLFMNDATVTGAGELAALRLLGAHIGGQLNLDRISVTNTIGPAMDADNLHTDSHLLMRDVTITGTGEDGAVRMAAAHIGGQLDLSATTITNTTGPALSADSLRTDDNLFIRHATITGTGEDGALRMVAAHIGGEFDLDHTTVTNTTGPALHAGNLHIDSQLFMRDATITGTGDLAAVRLPGARIGGQVDLTDLRLSNASGPLLALTEAQVSAALFLPVTVVCPHSGTGTGVTQCPGSARQIILREFVFSQLRDISWRQWLHLLVHHTAEYWPQPYQQLAAVERAAGHDNNARHVLITQQDQLRRRVPEALGGPIGRWRHRLWGWLGRYGYRAHRLVTTLMVVLLLAGATGYLAGQITTRPDHHAAERVQPATTPSTTPGTACSTAELIGLGIDRGLPLGATGLRARCDLDTTTHAGQTLTYVLWGLQALLWALATLSVAAYTGLVRKPV